MYCPACGVKNEKGRALCAACGNRLPLLARTPAFLPARFFWLFHCQSLVVLAALGLAGLALLALGWVAYIRFAPVYVTPAPPPAPLSGPDVAVSGCWDATLGLPGHVDNHLHLSAVRDPKSVSEVDITYPGARWHDPCSGGRGWQIVVVRSGVDQLDLYFESATQNPVPVTYTVTLGYPDGTQEVHTLPGTSGEW